MTLSLHLQSHSEASIGLVSLQRKAERAGQILTRFQTFLCSQSAKQGQIMFPPHAKHSFYRGSGFGGDVLAH